MKSPIRMVDEALMAATDGLVIWAWNRFEVKRVWLVLTPLGGQIVGAAAERKWVFAAVIGMLGLLEMWSAQRPAKVHNTAMAYLRQSTFFMCFRVLLLAYWAIDVVSGLATGDAGEVWRAVAAGSYILLANTFTPEHPPKRRREVKLAAARGTA